MQLKGFLQNPKFKRTAFVTIGFIVLYLLWNIFAIGGETIIDEGNAIVAAVVALFAFILFFRASMVKEDTTSRPIWLGMGLGFGLWWLADSIWAYYSMVLQEEIPAPSFADYVWIIAYVPLVYALVTRYRNLKSRPSRGQIWLVLAISLCIILISAIFVLRPILAEFDPQRAVEGMVNLFYPLGDLVLFAFAFLVLVLLQEGRYAMSWRLIAAGTLIMTLSDLLYSYAVWHGFYYPDDHANAISILVDTSYAIAYICTAFGIYLYGLVREIKEKFSFQMEFAPSTRLYTFLATDAQNKIIDASDNFYLLVNGKKTDLYNQTTLVKALGLSHAAIQSLFEKILHEVRLFYEPLRITTQDNQSRETWLIAEADYDPQHDYSGSIIVLIADVSVPEELRKPKNRGVLQLMNNLLDMAGSRLNDVSQEMRDYFVETIRLLSSILIQFGGPHYQDALFEELKRSAEQKRLPVIIDQGMITTPQDVQGEELACLLAPLLQTARDFVAGYVGSAIVDRELDDLESQINKAELHDLDAYRLRAFHLPA